MSLKRRELGVVFELSAESVMQAWTRSLDSDNEDTLCSPPARINLPGVNGDAVDLMLLTKITVFDSIILRDYESGLTYPTVLTELSRIKAGDYLEFQYITGQVPGLRWKHITAGGNNVAGPDQPQN